MTPYINGQPKVLYSLGRCVPGGRLRPCHTRLPQPRAPAPPRPGPRLLRVVSAGRSGGAEAPVMGRRGGGIRAGQQPPCGPRRRGHSPPDGHDPRPFWRRRRPRVWPGGGTDLAPEAPRPTGQGGAGASRGHSLKTCPLYSLNWTPTH